VFYLVYWEERVFVTVRGAALAAVVACFTVVVVDVVVAFAVVDTCATCAACVTCVVVFADTSGSIVGSACATVVVLAGATAAVSATVELEKSLLAKMAHPVMVAAMEVSVINRLTPALLLLRRAGLAGFALAFTLTFFVLVIVFISIPSLCAFDQN
jgi:hypothetical protein